MVDFAKRVGKAVTAKPLEPQKIYESLDRASDKGPLRPAQVAILAEWHSTRRADRDLIVKLQTGQGKTLIGLLMLQSKLNEGKGPVAFLCADRFLVQQTIKQAREFGFKSIASEPDAEAFLDGRSVLINTVDKLFNGFSRFDLGVDSIEVGTVLLDDAHACSDSVRQAFTISLPRDHDCYGPLVDLFSDDLEFQGPGSFADIKNGIYDSFLPVPYWAWNEKVSDVTRFLAKRVDDKKIKFPWSLIKDELAECECVISGGRLEIAPRLPRLDVFGSYWRAKHRIFMSATITNDAFLIKGLNIDKKAIIYPLTYNAEKWYGEKMVLIPSLLDGSLTRDAIVSQLAATKPKRLEGHVALTPSFKLQSDWTAHGALGVDKGTIDAGLQRLFDGDYAQVIVLANKYDGIDLPDDTCRVLTIDSKPYSESLIDRNQDACRSSSEATQLKKARTIEQGMGRGVRGQRDYCAVVLIGASLIRAMRTGQSKLHFSEMTHKQIEIGLAVAELAREDISEGASPSLVLDRLIRQCLGRDAGWKEFYAQEMDTVEVRPRSPALLDLFVGEMDAEQFYQQGQPQKAMETLQGLIETHIPQENKDDRGWYLQEMARYKHSVSVSEANALQIQAHKVNRSLLRPKIGMKVEPLIVSQKRIDNIRQWISTFENNEALLLAVDEIVANVIFGVRADNFEEALHRMGIALGFACQRPDRDYREGPDNLWALRDGQYLLFEAKTEVDESRSEIYKTETGQMNNSCAWFKSHYPGALAKKILIHPSKQLGSGAGFNESVQIVRKSRLKRLSKAFSSLFSEFKQLDLGSVSDSHIQQVLQTHHLGIDALLKNYYDEEPLVPK